MITTEIANIVTAIMLAIIFGIGIWGMFSK